MHTQAESVAVLVFSGVVLVFAVQAMAHARLLSADVGELEKLHAQGLLASNSTLEQDFKTVTYLLSTIAPALYMRQELWVRMYFYMLRGSRFVLKGSRFLEGEMRRLVAYQAAHYRDACARIAEI